MVSVIVSHTIMNSSVGNSSIASTIVTIADVQPMYGNESTSAPKPVFDMGAYRRFVIDPCL